MMRLPRRTALTAATAIAIAVAPITVAGCGNSPGDPPVSAPSSTSPTVALASAAAGSLRLSEGWVVATAPLVGMTPTAAASGSATPAMAAAPSMAASAAYAVIRNAGDADDRLVSVSTPTAGEAQLHTTVENSSGGGTMKRVTSIPVPAHGSLTLQMGGYHVMLLNLPEPLDEGDMVTMTWTFQSGTSITTAFPVISRVHRPGA